MTVETFRRLTATTPAPELRRAITAALVVERPSAGEGFTRFYRRVVAELGTAAGNDDQASRHAVLAGVLQQGAITSVLKDVRVGNLPE